MAREVRYPLNTDVLFDSNLIDANDRPSLRDVMVLSELLLANPATDIFFSLISLNELLAPKDASTRIELLKRLQALCREFGDRVNFFAHERFASVRAEWNDDGSHVCYPASALDGEISASIDAGDLVGVLKATRDDWEGHKAELRADHERKCAKFSAEYMSNPIYRENFRQSLELFETENALDQCDDIAKMLIVEFGKRPVEDLEVAKANHAAYPCTWTYSLLHRLADYAATLSALSRVERRASFPRHEDLLESHRNDYVDAYIASTGGACGVVITEDTGLIARLNFLRNIGPSLVRLQGFTVNEALSIFG